MCVPVMCRGNCQNPTQTWDYSISSELPNMRIKGPDMGDCSNHVETIHQFTQTYWSTQSALEITIKQGVVEIG